MPPVLAVVGTIIADVAGVEAAGGLLATLTTVIITPGTQLLISSKETNRESGHHRL